MLAIKLRGTALVSLALAVGRIPTVAQAVSGCGASDPAGYFTGVVSSQQNGRLDVSLNLRCADDRYDGTLITPLGTFSITSGSAHSNNLHLVFAIGSEAGTIDAIFSSDSLQGSFTAVGDSGSLALSRIGEPLASGWEEPTLDLPASQWREDLAFFAQEIAARHGNAFHAIPKVQFDSLVAALDQRLDHLNGDQVYVELDRMANLIGDAHTYITIPGDAPRFPFAVRRFGTDYRVVAVAKGSERMLGSRLVKVQEMPTPVVIQRLLSLTPADENPSLRQARAESFLSSGTILHGSDITPARDAVTLTLEDNAGQESRLRVRALPRGSADTLTWKDVFTAAPLFSQEPHQSFWYQYLPQARVVYCNFRGYDSLPARAAGLLKLIDRVRPEKVVIDMRQNGGGDFELGLRYLIEPLSRTSYINRRGRLFVAIGYNTFSAGMANAAQFRTRTKAILVGETIGEKPNSYQEPRELLLPNSHLKMRFSTRYYRFVEQGPNAVEPDYSVVPTWAEYRVGHDPVLELVLRYPRSRRAPHRKTPSAGRIGSRMRR